MNLLVQFVVADIIRSCRLLMSFVVTTAIRHELGSAQVCTCYGRNEAMMVIRSSVLYSLSSLTSLVLSISLTVIFAGSLVAECYKGPKGPPYRYVHRPGRSCNNPYTCRVHLLERNVPKLLPLDVSTAAADFKIPLLSACPFLELWPDHQVNSCLVRRKAETKAYTLHALHGLNRFFDIEKGGPSLYTLFAWKREPTRKEAARLIRHIINSFDCHYIAKRHLLPLERELAMRLPTGERFPIRFRLNPLSITQSKDLGWQVEADALVYDRAMSGIYRYSFDLVEGMGTVDVTPLVNATTAELVAFREIVEDYLCMDDEH